MGEAGEMQSRAEVRRQNAGFVRLDARETEESRRGILEARARQPAEKSRRQGRLRGAIK